MVPRGVLLYLNDPSMIHDVTMFDVGHGDCVLIRNSDHIALLVDCGAQLPKCHLDVVPQIEMLSTFSNACGFVISHYHEDHFSLYRKFTSPQKLFSKVYIPSLPVTAPGRQAGFALMEYFMLACVAQFRHYRIIPEIFTTFGRQIVPIMKGDRIIEAGLEFEVIWPDLTSSILGRPSLRKKARRIRAQLRPYLEKYQVPLSEDYSMEKFLDDCARITERPYTSKDVEALHIALGSVENEFRDVADDFSLGIVTKERTKNHFLFLGDLSNCVLNNLSVPTGVGFDCVKSSHHGTRFGKSLSRQTTCYLLVSRSRRDRPSIGPLHEGYLNDMTCRTILTTEFLGTCHIS